MNHPSNPLQMRGLAFVEFASPDPEWMHRVFQALGFSLQYGHSQRSIFDYNQHAIHFLLNRETDGSASRFAEAHGPSVSALGWLVDNPMQAQRTAVSRGARAVEGDAKDLPYPALYGIGDSLIYLVDSYWHQSWVALEHPQRVKDLGFLQIDHLTNNVYQGTLGEWSDFYRHIFGFTEVRHFDIDGQETGLRSYALRSPDGSFCIPINEGKDERSQIDEYLREYRGAGVQHIALLSNDLLASLDGMDPEVVQTLDINPEYYQSVFDRVPGVQEDPARIAAHQVLVDGDDQGYLLQIFSRNLFGPVFLEFIQRHAHRGFGEGNFQALFESIERDQQRRGVL